MKPALRSLFALLALLSSLTCARADESAGVWTPVPSGSGATYRVQPDGAIDYWDGRRLWRQTPDRTLFIWDNRRWIPAGAIFWGFNDSPGAPADDTPPARGFWIPSRLNVERDQYRRRYGQDLYYQYGPGHYPSS